MNTALIVITILAIALRVLMLQRHRHTMGSLATCYRDDKGRVVWPCVECGAPTRLKGDWPIDPLEPRISDALTRLTCIQVEEATARAEAERRNKLEAVKVGAIARNNRARGRVGPRSVEQQSARIGGSA